MYVEFAFYGVSPLLCGFSGLKNFTLGRVAFPANLSSPLEVAAFGDGRYFVHLGLPVTWVFLFPVSILRYS